MSPEMVTAWGSMPGPEMFVFGGVVALVVIEKSPA